MKIIVSNKIKCFAILIAVLCMPISTYADLIYTFDNDTEGWVNMSVMTNVNLIADGGSLVQTFYPQTGEYFDPYIGVLPSELHGSEYRYFVASILVEGAPESLFYGSVYFVKNMNDWADYIWFNFKLQNGDNIILIDLMTEPMRYGQVEVMSGHIDIFRLDLPESGGASGYPNDPLGFSDYPTTFNDWEDTIFRIDYVGLTNNPNYHDPITDPIPEPATLTLLGLGVAGMAYRKFRKSA